MRKDLRIKRNEIYYDCWEQLKNKYTMRDLAEIFNVPLASFYKIIKQYDKHTTNNNNSNSNNSVS